MPSSASSATWRDCAGLLVLALAIRMLWLGHAGLWADELFSLYWSQLDVRYLIGEGTRIETNPPVYYTMLHGWMQAFGTSAWGIRLLSVPFSAATVLVTYALGRSLLDRPTALLAGAFMAIDPTAILLAQQARAYGILGLLEGISLLSLARAAQAGPMPLRWLAPFVGSAIAAFLMHYSALFFIIACLAAVGLRLLATRPFPRRDAFAWGAAGLVIVLAIAALLIRSLSLSNAASLAWIGPMTPWTVGSFFLDLLTHPAAPRNATTFATAGVLLLVLAAALPWLRLNAVSLGILVLIPALFCLLVIGVSVWRPILLSRIGLWMIMPLCLLLARAATTQPTPQRRTGFAGVTTLALLIGLRHYFVAYQNEDWRGLAALLVNENHCPGPVLVSGDNALGLAYYAPALDARPVALMPLDPAERTTPEFQLTVRVMHSAVIDPAAVSEFVQTNPGTAVVLHSLSLKDIPPPLWEFLQHAPFHATVGGGLQLACY